MKKYLDKLPLALIFLIAVAFSIKSMREPDLWWQIRTGEWILEHHQIPKQDIFSYTFTETPWVNVKWGSEVLFALITKASGPECVFLLQTLVNCLIIFFLFRMAKAKTESLSIALLLSLVAMEYRIIGRPEMFSHLFTVVFLFLLLKYRKENSNKIFWLIPLQIFWANFHEAFGVGIVLTAIFVAGGWIEYFLSKRKWLSSPTELPKKLSLLLLLQVGSVIINPNGIKLLTQPLNILGQVYENKFTTELFDFRQPEYWQWNVYWVSGILVVGALGTLLHFMKIKTKSNRFKLFVEQFGVGCLLTLIAFIYLAATAYRNIIFLVLVFFPVLVFGIDSLLLKFIKTAKATLALYYVLCLTFAVLYLSIVSNKYYELTKSRDRFGLEVLSTFNPVGAAQFVRQNNLKGKCFSDYLTSSYLLWKLQPDFKSFIDLRDLDVFPSSFFNTFTEAVTFPDEFEKLDSTYHFNYVVLYRPQFATLHSFLFNESKFKLAFADAVACVYVKKDSVTDSSTIKFAPVKPVTTSPLGFAVNQILNPLYSSFDYTKVDNDLTAASYYLSADQLNQAEIFATKSARKNIENYKGKEMLGEVYYNRALYSTDVETRNKLLSAAGAAYQQALYESDQYAPAYLGLGAVYFQQKNFQLAFENFEHAIALDKNNLNAYNFAAECCKYFINQNRDAETYLQKAISFYCKADKLNANNPTIILNLGFLYFRKGDCDNTKKYLSKVSEFPGFTEEQRKSAKECLRKCGQ